VLKEVRHVAMTDTKKTFHDLAQQAVKDNKATAWFDTLYQQAKGDADQVPWARLTPHPEFSKWLEANPLKGSGHKALVIGSGLGDDAEKLSRHGFDVTAFDISPTAIDWCRKRYPKSKVHYMIADLFERPSEWKHAYDFVLESYTIQSLPLPLREKTIAAIAPLVGPGGTLHHQLILSTNLPTPGSLSSSPA